MSLRFMAQLLLGCLLLLGACNDPLELHHYRCDGGRCQGGKDGAADLPDGFLPGDCDDGERNAFETGLDCGGPDCTACATGEGCALDTYCLSNFCVAGSCRPDECRNGMRDGDETDVDCGGACGPCDGGKMCAADADCASQSCSASHRCDGPSCTDAERNGDESDVDCGGERCPACALGAHCASARDCGGGSADCSDEVCVDLSCSDGEQNNSETDRDCGGGCDACATGLSCTVDADCASAHCVASVCVDGPSAGFSLSVSGGDAPLLVQASSEARAGSAPIVEISYDWDDGAGFEPFDETRYADGGSFVVRQRVRDQNGISVVATRSLEVGGFVPVRFDPGDHTDNVFLSPDRLAVELRGVFAGGVRSNRALAPRSGVFYFEARRLIERTGFWGFGVATAAAPLDNAPGSNPESMGVVTLGEVLGEGSACTGEVGFDLATRDYGFVIDYRAEQPTVHVVLPGSGETATVRRSCVMSVSAPLHIFYFGARYVVGFQGGINAGSDTTNFPFRLSLQSVRDALTVAGHADAALALVPGFGQTRARPADVPPQLAVPADQTVALGTPLPLSATAMDAEDGPLTSRIVWTDTATQHLAPLKAFGGSFTFTPAVPGRHPLLLAVRDAAGVETRRTVTVTVSAALPQASPVRLAPDPLGGEGVALSENGLSARFEGQGKYGVRANQGIYGQFWYFEAHREQAPGNQGVGLVIGDGALNPYHFEDVPWSCSINLTGSTWRNLISLESWEAQVSDDYGFAVDYRGEHPIVYVLIENALQATLTLDDVWVPLYPMVYGNPNEPISASMDLTVNFGATPFRFDPRPVLGARASGLELRWGANTVPQP
jgi:hypothetical protein